MSMHSHLLVRNKPYLCLIFHRNFVIIPVIDLSNPNSFSKYFTLYQVEILHSGVPCSQVKEGWPSRSVLELTCFRRRNQRSCR